MTSNQELFDAFVPIKWATPYLNSPNWRIRERTRDSEPNEDSDRFPRDTMRSYDGVQHWLELYEKPATGSKTVTKTVSLIKYGMGLHGFPGICHGGAVMTLMDEALAFAMVANETEAKGKWAGLLKERKNWIAEGKSLTEVLDGYLVTARLDLKFLKPVLCPGIVGVEVDMLENQGHKMRMRGVMKDGNGTPLMQADGTWVRISRDSKL